MRSTTIIETDFSDEQVREKLGAYLVSAGFAFKKYKKQMVWKKGYGVLTAPQLFNIYKKENSLYIEGWLATALFPGVYVGESGLDNNYGFAIKKVMRKHLRYFIDTFMKQGTTPEGYVPK